MKRKALIIFGVIAVLAILGTLAGEDTDLTPTTLPAADTQLTAEEYEEQYGGNADVYQDVLDSTDCDELSMWYDLFVEGGQDGLAQAAEDTKVQVGCAPW